MAGTMGGGGLGKIAIQYGYQRFNVLLMVVTVILLIILVQLIQVVGHRWTRHLNLKRGKGLNKIEAIFFLFLDNFYICQSSPYFDELHRIFKTETQSRSNLCASCGNIRIYQAGSSGKKH